MDGGVAGQGGSAVTLRARRALHPVRGGYPDAVPHPLADAARRHAAPVPRGERLRGGDRGGLRLRSCLQPGLQEGGGRLSGGMARTPGRRRAGWALHHGWTIATPPTSSDPRRILIVRYSALGDVVLATSVLEPLRRRFPTAELEWITNAAYAPLLDGLPELSRVYPLTRWGVRDSPIPFALKFRGRFDLVVDLQHRAGGWVATVGSAPRRLVIHLRSIREMGRAALGREAPTVRAHATELYAEVLTPLGITGPGRIRVHLSPSARERASAALGNA